MVPCGQVLQIPVHCHRADINNSAYLYQLNYQLTYSGTSNKGHVGDNINSFVLSFIEKLSSSKCIKTIGRVNFSDLKQCPL